MTDLIRDQIERRIDKDLERLKKAMEICCPQCGHEFDMEARLYHVTYWGEDGPKETQCDSCDCVFTVEEEVTRIWKVSIENEKSPDDD